MTRNIQPTQTVLGIDIAQRTFEVAWRQGEHSKQATFSNDPDGFARLARWLAKRCEGPLHACLEATGRYGDALAHHLHAAGHTVSVVNPAQIHAFARSRLQRNKTDRADALLIAHFCQLHRPKAWTPPTPQARALQEMVRRVAALTETRQQERNRQSAGVSCARVQATITRHLAFLNAEIAQLEADLQAHIAAHPDLQQQHELLVSIPGIGAQTAATLLGEVGTFDHFHSAAQLAAYAGLTPRQYQSGTSVHRPSHLCKTGNAALRKALYFPALAALRYNPLIQALRDRLRAAGKRPMQIVGAAMRKLLHLAFGVLKSGKPFDPTYHQPIRTT